MIDNLVDKKWCSHFGKILENSFDHDSKEKVLTSMINQIEECKNSFKDHFLYKILQKLKEEYFNLIHKENDDDIYFSAIYDLIEKILEKINFDNQDL